MCFGGAASQSPAAPVLRVRARALSQALCGDPAVDSAVLANARKKGKKMISTNSVEWVPLRQGRG